MLDDTEKETIGSSKSAFHEMVFIHTSAIQDCYLVHLEDAFYFDQEWSAHTTCLAK